MRIYAKRDDNGKKILVEIQCDGCSATIKPNPTIQDSGWTKEGWQEKSGESYHTNDYCPSCRR